MITSLRYFDTFAKLDGAWLFAQRRLYVDWIDERALSGPTVAPATQTILERPAAVAPFRRP